MTDLKALLRETHKYLLDYADDAEDRGELINLCNRIDAALSDAGEPVAREGFQWVPVEPTEVMLKHGDAAENRFLNNRYDYPSESRIYAVYKAMLTAAPTKP